MGADLIEDKEPWMIESCGGVYQIKHDTARGYLAPKWYVQRMNDLSTSKRYYSRPSGAFTALSTGAIEWEK
jgi:hypothetical protein